MSKLKDNFFRISVFIKDKDKKSFFKITKEVLTLFFKNKRFPLYYFGRFLYRKEVVNPSDYLTMKEFYKIIKSEKLNPEEFTSILDNKLSFSFFCNKYNFPIPVLTSYNFSNHFFINDKLIILKNDEEIIKIFKRILNSDIDVLILKPIKKYGGKGIISIRKNNLENDIKINLNYILNNSFIHQKFIEQHPKISSIYKTSVNTMRVDTYTDKKGVVHILATTMRFGTNGSFVDNVSSGGFFVPVNSNGILHHKGFQSMITGGKTFTKHPDTNIIFNGVLLPFYKESLELCKNLCNYFPLRLVGWDVALTNNGPVVIEGNSRPGIGMGELNYGGYKKNPLFNEIINEA